MQPGMQLWVEVAFKRLQGVLSTYVYCVELSTIPVSLSALPPGEVPLLPLGSYPVALQAPP